jgi:Fe-S-cluster containining protein
MNKQEPICTQCGLCCQLFSINLDEAEYKSGKFKTIFGDLETFEDFAEAEVCGAHLLAQTDTGACIYLQEGKCSIHERRPAVCQEFFCRGTEPKFAEMRKMVEEAKWKK